MDGLTDRMTEPAVARLNARLHDVPGAEPVDFRSGALTAYIPAILSWDGRCFDPGVLADVRDAVSAMHGGRGLFGLSLEIGSGSIKLFARRWLAGETATVANIKLQAPHGHGGKTYASALNRLIDIFAEGLSLIPPADFDPSAPERLFAAFAEPRDFLCVYGTQSLRVLTRAHGREALERVRILDGDEEGLIAFASIVPEAAKALPGTMALEIGSGSTEIVRAGNDGRPHALTLAIGGKTGNPPLAALEKLLATGKAGHRIDKWLESGEAAVAAFFADPPQAQALYINASRASAGFRDFARGFHPDAGEEMPIDDALVTAFQHAHPHDKFGTKALILLAVGRGLGLKGYREGTRGGLKMGVAALLSQGLLRFKG